MIRTASWAALAAAALLSATTSHAATTDLAYAPQSAAGHDLAQAPLGQSFVALAPGVRAGIHLADQTSHLAALGSQWPGEVQSYPYPVAASVKVNVKLLDGEGTAGAVLDSRNLSIAAPSNAPVEIDYAALGIVLTVGRSYTLLLSDVSNQAYPNARSGWLVPTVIDYGSTAVPKTGAYANGLPIVQGTLLTSDAGIGDQAFEVVDQTGGTLGSPASQATAPTCVGANAVITSIGRGFMVVSGGSVLTSHVWYAPQKGSTFEGGTTTVAVGELVDFSGVLNATAGCYADLMTIKPARAALLVDGTLPFPQATVAYSATLAAFGGNAPFAWSASGLPAGLTFANGKFSGTPTTAGAYSVAVSLTDAAGRSATANYALTVTAAPPAPTCTKPANAKALSGSGRVNAVSATSVTIGLVSLSRNNCTKLTLPAGKTALAVGQTASYTGYTVGTQRTAQTISVR